MKRSVQVEQDALAKQHSDHLRALRLKEKECAEWDARLQKAQLECEHAAMLHVAGHLARHGGGPPLETPTPLELCGEVGAGQLHAGCTGLLVGRRRLFEA